MRPADCPFWKGKMVSVKAMINVKKYTFTRKDAKEGEDRKFGTFNEHKAKFKRITKQSEERRINVAFPSTVPDVWPL